MQGIRLNLASSDFDVTVYIGDQQCTNISLGQTLLTCNVPIEEPSSDNEMGSGLAVIVSTSFSP